MHFWKPHLGNGNYSLNWCLSDLCKHFGRVFEEFIRNGWRETDIYDNSNFNERVEKINKLDEFHNQEDILRLFLEKKI